MTNCKVENITKEGKRSYGIRIETPKGEVRMVPVVDVRDGDTERCIAKRIIKATNHSKFMQPSYGVGGGSYQASYKRN